MNERFNEVLKWKDILSSTNERSNELLKNERTNLEIQMKGHYWAIKIKDFIDLLIMKRHLIKTNKIS